MMNTVDDCELLEEVVNMTNVRELNVTVSIKIQQLLSRCAKYLYYDCTRDLCKRLYTRQYFFLRK